MLRSGKKVRAGARDVAAAEEELEEAVAAGQLRPDEARRVQVVAFDLEDGASIRAALSGVGKVRGSRGIALAVRLSGQR